MKKRNSVIRGGVAWAFATAILAAFSSAKAYTPQSPEVRQLVAKAIGYLESDAASDGRMGAKALVGMTLLKNGAKKNHVKIVDTVKLVRKFLGKELEPRRVHFDEIYSPGMAVLFLLELDSVAYASEIQCLLDFLALAQKPHGGWGYFDRQEGDTSMTQYAVLGMWEAREKGFRVSDRAIENVTIWLVKTQDPSGAFGYQGKVSDSFELIAQSNVRHSLAAAGLGSTYVCADLLGLSKKPKPPSDIPSALKKVEKEKPDGRMKSVIHGRLIQMTQQRGNKWFAEKYCINPERYTHYYMYALERYMSFRQLVEKGGFPKVEGGEAWYNDGVNLLMNSQSENGSWSSGCKPTADTAFATLFLLRSAKISIEKAREFGDGILVGGRGLPKQTGRVELHKGKVVARPLLGPAEQLLAALEDSDIDDAELGEAVDVLARLPSQKAKVLVGKHAEKLRQLAANRSPAARMAAVRALAKTRNLDNVPILIYALTDPDPAIAVEARNGLRRISRRPEGFALGDKPTEADRREVVEKWKAWYLAIRPDAEFEN